MQYELRLTLRQMAALKVTISFWESKEVVDKTKEFFEFCDRLERSKIKDKWCKLTKTMIDKKMKEELPETLKAELVHIIRMIGKTIFYWHQYIRDEFETRDQSFTWSSKIYWTPYGTIDVVKTFKLYWSKNPNLDISKVYNFACAHIMKDDIDHLLNKMPNNTEYFHNYNYFITFDQYLQAYWKYCKSGQLHNLLEYFERVVGYLQPLHMENFNVIYNRDCSLEDNMLRLSVFEGHYLAVKYFWKKLTTEEKENNKLICARIAVMCNNYTYNAANTKGYQRSQYVDICMFFINQMSECNKKIFFNEKIPFWDHAADLNSSSDIRDEILNMLLSVWPWQELYIPVLKDILLLQDNNSEMPCFFLESITSNMYCDYLLGYSMEDCEYRYLLRQAWHMIPGSGKKKLKPRYPEMSFIGDLMNVWDVYTLRIIFNDPAIITLRDEFINDGVVSYVGYLESDRSDKLNELKNCLYSRI